MNYLDRLKKSPLWSQKFYRVNVDEESLGSFSKRSGEIFCSSYLENAINYIDHNREKHGLSNSNELQKIINGFVIGIDEAYGEDSIY